MKIGKYFTTYTITAGFFIALLGSLFLYLAWFDAPNRLLETISAILFFWLLLQVKTRVWFWVGFFIALLWFWWIVISFFHYRMVWAIPLGLLFMATVYGFLFLSIAWVADLIGIKALLFYNFVAKKSTHDPSSLLFVGMGATRPTKLFILIFKALGLLWLSTIHPLGFDWLKPELLFVHSYIGIHKWQLGLVLLAIVLAQWQRKTLFLLLILLAYSPDKTVLTKSNDNSTIALVTTKITVKDKWDPTRLPSHISIAKQAISKAIENKKNIVVLPESIFPFFLNRNPKLLGELLHLSNGITIIIGALYLDGNVHRNSTYIFHKGRYKIANKVLLVPFGEGNPLPAWAGKWVNRVFFDGAVDYIASPEPTDFELYGSLYRNAICYEATSEKLYRNTPKQMIVTSNNGWFTPSIEPTLQRLLLEYYSRKYGTTIYHSVNMSPSYRIISN